MDELQYRCPIHGVVATVDRDGSEPGPDTCPLPVGATSCGERLSFALVTRVGPSCDEASGFLRWDAGTGPPPT
jgi:hypothetical protein